MSNSVLSRNSRKCSSRTLLVVALMAFLAPATPAISPSGTYADFSNPQPVTLLGYTGDAMEPFLTRDGRYLFFNNSNDPRTNTDLFWAERVDDLTFRFRGEILGVNTPALEGVPSMDGDGRFYFVSNRSYNQTASTLYRGRFSEGHITGIELVPGVSLAKPGIVNFDAEISDDGAVLYFVESHFDRTGHPRTASILFARRSGDHFIRAEDSSRIMAAINTGTLNYAPAVSPSQLEIFFTRLDPGGPRIYAATRSSADLPFEAPRRIEAITGFVEAPTLSPDGRSLYFHRKVGDHFVLYRVTR